MMRRGIDMGEALKISDFPPQKKSDWCWAAVCAAFQKHYGKHPDTQDGIANLIVGGSNSPALLTEVLSKLGYHFDVIPPPFLHYERRFIESLGKNIPICAEVGMNGATSHAVLLYGWERDENGVLHWLVYDPSRKNTAGHDTTTFVAVNQDWKIGNYPWLGAYVPISSPVVLTA